jgi:branched-chain amino acid transport system ATP-binding protein
MRKSSALTWAVGPDMLRIEKLECGYGSSQVLFGVDLGVEEGECVGLVGRNGMGKTTTVHSIFGMTKPDAGRIEFRGRELRGLPSNRIAGLGLGLVPEGRRVFPKLTVRENLVATAANYSGTSNPWTVGKVLDLFPPLAPRMSNFGGQLSGGEQQMVAIGRALMLNPHLLVLDEVTEGLAPLIQEQIWSCLRVLRAAGQSILIIDKNLEQLCEVAGRIHVMQSGRIVWSGDASKFEGDAAAQAFMGIPSQPVP